MSQLTFDTLKFVKTLENAGISKEHAEAITHAQKEAFGELVAAKDLATRKDLLEMKSSLQLELANVKSELLKWFMGTALAIISVTIAGFAVIISMLQ